MYTAGSCLGVRAMDAANQFPVWPRQIHNLAFLKQQQNAPRRTLHNTLHHQLIPVLRHAAEGPAFPMPQVGSSGAPPCLVCVGSVAEHGLRSPVPIHMVRCASTFTFTVMVMKWDGNVGPDVILPWIIHLLPATLNISSPLSLYSPYLPYLPYFSTH